VLWCGSEARRARAGQCPVRLAHLTVLEAGQVTRYESLTTTRRPRLVCWFDATRCVMATAPVVESGKWEPLFVLEETAEGIVGGTEGEPSARDAEIVRDDREKNLGVVVVRPVDAEKPLLAGSGDERHRLTVEQDSAVHAESAAQPGFAKPERNVCLRQQAFDALRVGQLRFGGLVVRPRRHHNDCSDGIGIVVVGGFSTEPAFARTSIALASASFGTSYDAVKMLTKRSDYDAADCCVASIVPSRSSSSFVRFCSAMSASRRTFVSPWPRLS
jgi:hypothetical protein